MIVRGVVVRGKGEARGIGYPTANIAYGAVHASPLQPGIFLARVLVGTTVHRALAVVGMWTQKENGLPSLEVHLLDFSSELYGQSLTVSLSEKLRDLLPFTDVPALVAQITKDVEDARAIFS